MANFKKLVNMRDPRKKKWTLICRICPNEVVPPYHQYCKKCGERINLGAPPDGSPLQCTRILKNGKRCRQFKLRGEEYCKHHSKKYQGKFGKRRSRRTNTRYSVYAGLVLGPTLTNILEGEYRKAPDKVHDLRAELALSRAAGIPLLQQYNDLFEWACINHPILESNISKIKLAMEKGEADDEDHKNLDNMTRQLNSTRAQLLSLGRAVQENNEKVAILAEKSSKVYLDNADVVPVERIGEVVQQIIEVIVDVCPQFADKIQQKIATYVQLPTTKQAERYITTAAPHRATELLKEMVNSLPFDPTVTNTENKFAAKPEFLNNVSVSDVEDA